MTRISAEWVTDPAVLAVADAIEAEGGRAYFVGGCVRNALLGAAATDIDLATALTPDQVQKAAAAVGLRSVPTGIDHGTITVVSQGRGFEVTTFRKDVETFGRHAVVAYSTDLAEDAARRDFTMNALYADRSGNVIDPLGGLKDLAERRVRFVGDAGTRIREDYLRSLRFFRFHAWYGDPQNGLDAEALAAISANLPGLDTLSAERVGAELLKLLGAPDPAPAVAAMQGAGVLQHILPGADPRALAPLVHFEGGRKAEPIRRLAAILPADTGADLRLSRAEMRRWATLRRLAESGAGVAEMAYREGGEVAVSAVLLRAALLETDPPEAMEAEAARGAEAVFPVSAADLMPGLSGAALGDKLKALEARWIASDFTLDRAALLAG